MTAWIGHRGKLFDLSRACLLVYLFIEVSYTIVHKISHNATKHILKNSGILPCRQGTQIYSFIVLVVTLYLIL